MLHFRFALRVPPGTGYHHRVVNKNVGFNVLQRAAAVMETCSVCSLRPVVNYLSLYRYAAELNSAHNETMKQLGKCW